MATLHLVLDENDRMMKVTAVKDVHSVAFHLSDFYFSDQEILDYAQTAAMMLLSAVQTARGETKQ